MISEKIYNIGKKDPMTFKTSEVKENIYNGRVDINDLLARVRKEKTKENKINLFFFGMLFSLILIIGMLLSF